MENMELQMTDTPNYSDCADKCAFAKLVTDLSREIKHCIKYPLFVWTVGGLASTFLVVLLLLFATISNVNDNVNDIRLMMTDRMARIETRIDIIQPPDKK